MSDVKVAIVTGGAVRVGRAITLALARAGYDLVIHYNRSQKEAEEAQREVQALGRMAVLVQGDVALKRNVEQVVARANELGRLDLLVNNASIFQSKPVLEITEEEWDRVLAVNLKGPFLLAQAAAPLLAAAGGSIVNVVDLSAFQAWPSFAHHAVSKAGLLHLTRVLARALGPEIRVNAVAPGPVLPPGHYTADQIERSRKRTVLGRWGSPDDVARTVLFLAESPYITGDVVVVDGGRLVT
ncbi:MAG: SDR family oxidoreductase [Gemmatimonadetes bacterium]|nr:SDR family oxidoreductase [Gemmatimonadota bacterium]